MKSIIKGREPRTLTEYRLQNSEYDGPGFSPVKNDIKSSLLAEQGYLCAYCMARISADSMKVEHWACQDRYGNLQLVYSNMLGCCKGGEDADNERGYDKLTCDSRKGNLDIKFNPSNPQDHIGRVISYDGNGVIFSNDEEFNHQINNVLNLNKSRLKDNRRELLQNIRHRLDEKAGHRTKAELGKLLLAVNNVDPFGKLREYCGFLAFYLEEKIKKV